MLTLKEQRIIRRAARAQRAFWQLLAETSTDPRRKLAMFDYRVAVDAELRGERRRPPAYDLSTPLDEAVRLELDAIAPEIRTRLVLQRASKMLATSCGPTQLKLSYTAAARQQLRVVVRESTMTQRELAAAIGVSETTLFRHLRGETMSRERRDWYHRLERIVREGSLIHVIVRAITPERLQKGLIAGGAR
jgi:hypothetical protein